MTKLKNLCSLVVKEEVIFSITNNYNRTHKMVLMREFFKKALAQYHNDSDSDLKMNLVLEPRAHLKPPLLVNMVLPLNLEPHDQATDLVDCFTSEDTAFHSGALSQVSAKPTGRKEERAQNLSCFLFVFDEVLLSRSKNEK